MSEKDRAVEAGRRRLPWLIVGVISLLLLGSGVWWALSTVLTPSEDALESEPYTYVAAAPGEVGSSIQLNTVAAWATTPIGINRAAGIVTGTAVTPGDELSQGSTLYTVNLRPVVIAQGDVPAFRAITSGTEGQDVAQLQAMLTARGHYFGPLDGRAEAGTVRAISAWQKSLGVPQTGAVEAGDVIFVPELPIRVVLNDEIVARGETLNGGEDAVMGLPVAPTFRVPVTAPQAAMMPTGTRVAITSPEGGDWSGTVVQQSTDADTGAITLSLEGEGGSSICGEHCEQIPVTNEALLRSQVVTVETVSGLVVPSAALITEADGEIAVVDEDDNRIPVTVVAAARGMSVVEGVREGTRVRVPGEGS